MFIRLVKLTIKTEKIEDFKALFRKYRLEIRNRDGCLYLEVLQDRTDPRIFFTYSKWEEEIFLNAYRESELFENVWGTAKTFFDAKPEAWSVDQLDVLE